MERLLHRLPFDDARGDHFHHSIFSGVNRAFSVNGLADGVHDPAKKRLAHRHLHDAIGPFDGVAFFDVNVLAKDGGADVVGLEVQHHAHDVAGKLQKLPCHGVLKAMESSDSIADADDRAGLAHFDLLVIILDLLLDNLADFFCSDLHCPYPFKLSLS